VQESQFNEAFLHLGLNFYKPIQLSLCRPVQDLHNLFLPPHINLT